jgi:hypothetical protein
MKNFPESLCFDSLVEWTSFCQDVGGIVPVYFWNGHYTVIAGKGRPEGEHGAVMLGESRDAVVHYATPGGGMLSYHWEASYGEPSQSRMYWEFEAAKDLPQEIDRGVGCWLRTYRQTDRPGLYEAITEDGAVLYPVLREKPARSAV